MITFFSLALVTFLSLFAALIVRRIRIEGFRDPVLFRGASAVEWILVFIFTLSLAAMVSYLYSDGDPIVGVLYIIATVGWLTWAVRTDSWKRKLHVPISDKRLDSEPGSDSP